MATYLLIESRDGFGMSAPSFCGSLAVQLARQGDRVALLLVQNGVLSARAGARANAFAALAQAGVQVLADDFSLRERGISAAELSPEVKTTFLDIVIDRLAAGDKVLWH